MVESAYHHQSTCGTNLQKYQQNKSPKTGHIQRTGSHTHLLEEKNKTVQLFKLFNCSIVQPFTIFNYKTIFFIKWNSFLNFCLRSSILKRWDHWFLNHLGHWSLLHVKKEESSVWFILLQLNLIWENWTFYFQFHFVASNKIHKKHVNNVDASR
jgi:hypothetical protein